MTPRINEKEFIALYAQHQGRLLQYVAAMVPHLQDAEDVLSETTVALWENFGDFASGTSFLAWARQIAYLRVLEFYRARKRRLMMPERLLERLAEESQAREAKFADKVDYLAECKDELSQQDRRLLEERYMGGMKVQILAQQWARPESSISKSLGRIRRTLLTCIERKMAAEERHGR